MSTVLAEYQRAVAEAQTAVIVQRRLVISADGAHECSIRLRQHNRLAAGDPADEFGVALHGVLSRPLRAGGASYDDNGASARHGLRKLCVAPQRKLPDACYVVMDYLAVAAAACRWLIPELRRRFKAVNNVWPVSRRFSDYRPSVFVAYQVWDGVAAARGEHFCLPFTVASRRTTVEARLVHAEMQPHGGDAVCEIPQIIYHVPELIPAP